MLRRKDYQSALDSRLAGQTYGEIQKALGVPKSTLSGWFKAINLSDDTKKILAKKTRQGILSLIEFNRDRTSEIIRENGQMRADFADKVESLNPRELMLVGASLYWAEGYKNFGQVKRKSYPYVCFSNSDPNMIMVFIRFLEEILDISRNELAASAIIYPSLDSKKTIAYWQKITGIPTERMRCYKALSSASSGKRPRNLLPNGTLQIRANNRLNFFKIAGLIDGIVKTNFL